MERHHETKHDAKSLTVDEAIAKLQAISLAGHGGARIYLEENFASDVELLENSAVVLML